MKVALIGATGFVGSTVLTELLNRGHEVTAIVRNPEKITVENSLLTVKSGNALNPDEVATLAAGNDVVLSAYNAGWTNPDIYNESLLGSAAIQSGTKSSGVKRYIVVGGAGGLQVAPGVQLLDTPEFPEEYKPGASANRDYYNILKNETELDWTVVCPPIEMHAGTSGVRTGAYRTDSDNIIFGENGRSLISVEDFAVAVVDELENPQHVNARFTVAY